MRLTRLFRTTGFRLAALYAGLFGVSVLALFGVIYWITSGALHQQVAANIDDEIAELVEDYQNGGFSHTAAAIREQLASSLHPATFYLLLDSGGRKVTGNLPTLRPRNGWQKFTVPSGAKGDVGRGSLYLLGRGMTLPDHSFLLVAKNTYHITEVKEAIVDAFAWAFGLTVLLGLIGGMVLSSGFLHRIDELTRASRAIIDGKLADRMPTRGTDDELDRLALNLNEMLDRIQMLMESLRQVSDDIAHDLRTPLSRLRQRLEGARLNARGIDDYEAATDAAIADTDAILGTFAALLRIAQIEAGTRKAGFSDVDLSDIFRSISETYAVVAEDRGQVLTASIESGVTVLGDRELLMQMLVNLVENAMQHTPEGTCITIALHRGENGPVGIVADTGPGIPTDDRDKVFRRFFRLQRSRSTPGSGLGLSLVAAVAALHGITVTLADNAPGLGVRLDFEDPASQ